VIHIFIFIFSCEHLYPLLIYFILFHSVINIYLFPTFPSLTHLLNYPLLLLLSVSASLSLLRDVITLYNTIQCVLLILICVCKQIGHPWQIVFP
jgi:hypothetical protein